MKVSAVIPALNEAKTVGNVVHVLKQSPLVDEVIVVSDGSTDRTSERAQRAGAHVVLHATTQGKGEALKTGVREAHGSIVVFFDADLIRLTTEHVAMLIQPVLDGACDMNVGLLDKGVMITAAQMNLPLLSGQRALKREIFDLVLEESLTGFGIETALNHAAKENGYHTGIVVFENIDFVRKFEKVGWREAFFEYAKMWRDVFRSHAVIAAEKIKGRGRN